MIEQCTRFGISELLFTIEEDLTEEMIEEGFHIVSMENILNAQTPAVYINMKEAKTIIDILSLAIERAETRK